MTASTGQAVTFTGDNAADITDLGVHVMPHPTQDALIVFAREGDLDPAGVCAVGQTVQVGPDGVTVVGMPDPGAATVATEDPALPPAPQSPFDPSDHSADEVQAYLLSLGDDPVEAQRVINAERASKNRKTVVGDDDQQ